MEETNSGNAGPVMGSGDEGKKEFTISIVGSVLGLICCPCVFSIVGIIFGNMAKKKGHPSGQLAMILGIVSFVLGLGIGAVVNMNNPALKQLMGQ